MADMSGMLGSVESALSKIYGILDKSESKVASIVAAGSKFSETVSRVTSGSRQGAGGQPGSNGNLMANSLGNVPEFQAQGAAGSGAGGAGGTGGTGGGVSASASGSSGLRPAAIAAGVASAVYNLTPGTSDAFAMQGALFPTAFAATGSYDKKAVGERIIQGIGLGASSTTDPVTAALVAAGRGFVFSDGDRSVDNMLKGAEFAHVMTGMSNQAAVAGLTDIYRGGSGVNDRLLSMGVSQINSDGSLRDLGEIVNELLKRGNIDNMSEEEFNKSMAMGFMGQTFSYAFGDSPELYSQAIALARTQVKSDGGVLRLGDGSALEATYGMGREESPFETISRTTSNQFEALLNWSEEIRKGADFMSHFNSGLAKAIDILVKVPIIGPLLGAGKGAWDALAGNFRSTGGDIVGRGSSTHDSVKAYLAPGEYVLNARAASLIGKDALDDMNSLGHEFGAGFASPAPVFLSKGGTTLSGNPALKSGSDMLTTVDVAGGRKITVAKEAAPYFQRLLSAWQSDPLLGGGRFDLSKGALGSYAYRKARKANALSDHAGWAIDVRYDVMPAGKRHMSKAEDAAVRKILAGFGGKIGWGGDYRNYVDEMHFYYRGKGGTTLNAPPDGNTEHGDPANDGLSVDGEENILGDADSLFKDFFGFQSAPFISGDRARPFTVATAFSLSGLSGSSGRMNSVSSTAYAMSSSSSSESYSSGADLSSASSDSGGLLGKLANLLGGAGSLARHILGIGSANQSADSGADVPVSAPVKGALSNKDLLSLLQRGGFTGQKLREAWAIVMRESSGRPSAHNPNRSTGDNSYGLFQINMLGKLGPERLQKFARYGVNRNEDLFDPWINVQVAAHMSQKGGNWSSWVSPQYGRAADYYRQFPQIARQAGLPGYSHGTSYVSGDQVANLHQGELVMPAAQAQMFRTALQEALSGARSGPEQVNVTLNIERASDEEAERFARKIVSIVKNEEKQDRLAAL